MSHNVSVSYLWFRQWGGHERGNLQPFLITCQMPKLPPDAESYGSVKRFPEAVSLVSK